MFLELIAESLIFIFPAYSANAVPVVLGGGYPIDFGKKFRDNRPIFGAHKTFRGFFAGLIIGTLVGVGESYVFPNFNSLLGFTISLGALMGDLVGAFFKRRLNLSPGALFPVIDQIDFALFAMLFSIPITPPTKEMVIIILIITIPIHLLTNFLAFLANIKKKPW